MKSFITIFQKLFGCLVAAVFSQITISTTQAQIFVANYGNGTIGEYNTSGSLVTNSLISGLTQPNTIAVSGSDIFRIPTPETLEVGTRKVNLSFEKLMTNNSSLKPATSWSSIATI